MSVGNCAGPTLERQTAKLVMLPLATAGKRARASGNGAWSMRRRPVVATPSLLKRWPWIWNSNSSGSSLSPDNTRYRPQTTS